jgi:formamidopyrimidine-DNA glycosylase
MPELPEVQTVVSSLKPHIINSSINSIKVLAKGESLIGKTTAKELSESLEGQSLEDVRRIGKFIIFDLQTTPVKLVVHLRMTGKFLFISNQEVSTGSSASGTFLVPDVSLSSRIRDEDINANATLPHPHVRIHMQLNNGDLYFIDMRRFATFHLVKSLQDYAGLRKLGPDALDGRIDSEYLQSILVAKTKPIYSALLDQEIVAGLGNIYVCETLARSMVHPLRPAGGLSDDELQEVVRNTKLTLQKAIAAQGTSFSDYTNAAGERGEFQNALLVYKQKEAVLNGKSYQVAKLKIAGRTAHYIPELQKL